MVSLVIFFPDDNADLLPLGTSDLCPFEIFCAHGELLELMDQPGPS